MSESDLAVFPVLACTLLITLFGWLGLWVAWQKGRTGLVGFLLGFLFGPFGVVIEVLLPNRRRD